MMAVKTRVEIKGLKELQAKLNELSTDMAQKVIFSAALASATVIRNQARSNVQAKGLIATRAMLNNVAVKRQRGTRSGLAEYHVGVRHGQIKKEKQRVARAHKAGKQAELRQVDDPYYWRFIEFGTKKMSPKPFLAPAFDSKKSEALDAMVKRIKQRIDKVGK